MALVIQWVPLFSLTRLPLRLVLGLAGPGDTHPHPAGPTNPSFWQWIFFLAMNAVRAVALSFLLPFFERPWVFGFTLKRRTVCARKRGVNWRPNSLAQWNMVFRWNSALPIW
jgi:hypothetical protein